MGEGMVDVGGARVGNGDCGGGPPVEGVGVANGAGVAVASLPPQANTAKLTPTTVRNRIDDGLFIGASCGPGCMSGLSKA